MNMQKRAARRVSLIATFSLGLLLCYNNCGPGFKSLTDASSTTDIASSTPTTTTTSTTVSLPPGVTTTTTLALVTTTTVKATTTTSTTLPSGGGTVTTTTTTMPISNALAQVAFPPNGATSDTHIVVRGSANASVTQVSVSGTAATITGSTWRADVPLNMGVNSLSVDVVSGGVSKPGVATISIERFATDTAIKRGAGAWAGRILGMAYDAANQRIIMSDDIIDGAWEMRLATGDRKIISDSESSPQTGTGIDLTTPSAVATSANQCFIVDQQLIAAINLTNGNRTLLIDTKTTSNFGDIYLTPDNANLIVLDLKNEAILKMSPINGTSTVISSAAVGSGTSTHNIADIGVSFSRNKSYFTTYYSDPIVQVDLTTGVRSSFSSAATGEPKFSDPRTVIVDDITDQAFVFDSKKLAAISLATGRRKAIGNTGTLSTLTDIVTMTMTPYGPVLLDYVGQGEGSNPHAPTMILIDPIEGTRLILSR